jgi:tetratricopeptide (TPR) repeat protein
MQPIALTNGSRSSTMGFCGSPATLNARTSIISKHWNWNTSLRTNLLLAQTLNHVGNWHFNRWQARQALTYHNEALALFRKQENWRGIAQTMDLLGIVSYQLGEVIQGTEYLEQAVPILRELDDRQGLVNTLTNLTVRALADTDPGFSSLLQRCTLLRWAIYPAVCGSQEKYVINIGVFETVAGQAYTQPSPNGCPSMSMFLLFIVVHLE